MQKIISRAFLTPIRAMKKQYIPLLVIYFAYGASAFSSIAMTFWQKEALELSAEQLISIGVWAMVPWTVKMVFGQMIDGVKIFGSRRKIYIFIGAGLMTLGSLILIGLATGNPLVERLGGEYEIFLWSVILTTIGFVIQDVTADTMTTEVVDRAGKSESEIQQECSMVQVLGRLSLSIAGFAVAGLGGWLAANFEPATIFWMTLAIPAISVLGAVFVRLESASDENGKIDWRIFGGGIGFGIFTIFMARSGSQWSQEIVFFVSFAILSAMLWILVKNLPPIRRKTLIFAMIALFLYRATPSVGPGMNWWAIDELGFDENFFGILAQIGAATALAILWIFADFFSRKPIRSALIFLIFVETVMALPELALFFKLHEEIGVDARTVALFDTAISSPLVQISMVLMLGLIAFHAPRGQRGTWFAIGASFMNLALSAGQLGTKYLNQIWEISRGNYENLGILMIATIAISFVVPMIGVLIFLKKSNRPAKIKIDSSKEAPIPPRREVEI